MSSPKEKYKSLLEDYYVPIFYQPWYLDTVCDSHWDVIIYEEEGELVGVWVYMTKSKLGLDYILHPSLCPYMGPLFFGSLNVKSAFHSMLALLPSSAVTIQDYFHTLPSIQDHKYLSNKKYTYIITQDYDVDILHSRLSSDRRRKIRKANEQFSYHTDGTVDELVAFLASSFSARGKDNPYHNIDIVSIAEQCKKYQSCKIVKCTDIDGKPMAMGLFLYDSQWVYNMITGVDGSYPHEAMSLMLWNEIKSALESDRSFDFEGSRIPGVESLYKSFQGEKVHYQSFYKSKNRVIDLLVKFKNPEILK